MLSKVILSKNILNIKTAFSLFVALLLSTTSIAGVGNTQHHEADDLIINNMDAGNINSATYELNYATLTRDELTLAIKLLDALKPVEVKKQEKKQEKPDDKAPTKSKPVEKQAAKPSNKASTASTTSSDKNIKVTTPEPSSNTETKTQTSPMAKSMASKTENMENKPNMKWLVENGYDKKIMEFYADNFTQDEFKQILEFYSSEVGKKYAGAMPEFAMKMLGKSTDAANNVGNGAGAKSSKKQLTIKGHPVEEEYEHEGVKVQLKSIVE